MILRPVDATGDILPVQTSRDLLTGPEAVARLVADKLSLLKGDWWENPEEGFEVLEFMKEARLDETTAPMFASRVTEFIRKVEGVFEVEEVSVEVEGRTLSYSCNLITTKGPQKLQWVGQWG